MNYFDRFYKFQPGDSDKLFDQTLHIAVKVWRLKKLDAEVISQRLETFCEKFSAMRWKQKICTANSYYNQMVKLMREGKNEN